MLIKFYIPSNAIFDVKKMKKLILVSFTMLSSPLSAQINVRGQEAIDPLVQSYKNESLIVVGYRIQICMDESKSVADAAKNKFLSVYPKTSAYMTFENPNFIVMVGDYRTLISAEKVQLKIQSQFTICTIHKTTTKLPRVD